MLTPFSISQGVTGQSAVWCRVKKSRALNSCQQHALASNQRTNANNTGRGTINHSVVAPLQPRTSERRGPERHGRAAGLVLLRSERCGPVSQTYWETETAHADSRCFFYYYYWGIWVSASKQTSLWPWLPGLIPHWWVQNKSQRCQGSSTRLSAGVGSWILTGWSQQWGGHHDCHTPLGLSQWACAPTTAASVKADSGVNPPRRGADWDSVVLIHQQPLAASNAMRQMCVWLNTQKCLQHRLESPCIVTKRTLLFINVHFFC